MLWRNLASRTSLERGNSRLQATTRVVKWDFQDSYRRADAVPVWERIKRGFDLEINTRLSLSLPLCNLLSLNLQLLRILIATKSWDCRSIPTSSVITVR